LVLRSPRGKAAINEGNTATAFSLDPKIETRLLKKTLASILLLVMAALMVSSTFFAATMYLDSSPEDCFAIDVNAAGDRYLDEYFALDTIASGVKTAGMSGFLDEVTGTDGIIGFDADVDVDALGFGLTGTPKKLKDGIGFVAGAGADATAGLVTADVGFTGAAIGAAFDTTGLLVIADDGFTGVGAGVDVGAEPKNEYKGFEGPGGAFDAVEVATGNGAAAGLTTAVGFEGDAATTFGRVALVAGGAFDTETVGLAATIDGGTGAVNVLGGLKNENIDGDGDGFGAGFTDI
jgi:hypothetical protein